MEFTVMTMAEKTREVKTNGEEFQIMTLERFNNKFRRIGGT
jgi:hypothetical protein